MNRPLVAGAAGSTCLAVGALGVGALPRLGQPAVQQEWLPVLSVLRSTASGRALATALVAVGVLGLVAAWWRLEHRHAVRAAAVWSLPLLLAPPVFSRDAYAYLAQARLVLAGLDPYEVGPSAVPGPLAQSVAAQYADAPSPYGAVFLALAARVVAVTGDALVAGVLGVRLLAVLGLVLAAWALPRLATRHDVDPHRALWLGLANPLVLLHGVAGAHNDLLMAGLLVTGLAVAHRSPVAATVVVVLAGQVKAPAFAALLVLPWLAAPRPDPLVRALKRVLTLLPVEPAVRRPRLRTYGTVAFAALAAVQLVTGLWNGWIDTLLAGVAGPSLFAPTEGLGRALTALTGEPALLERTQRAGVVLAAVLSGGLLLAARRLGPVRALGLALVVVAALGESVQPWYLLWGLLPLAAATGRRTAAGLAAASAVLALSVLPNGRPLLRGPVWGLPVVLAAAAGLAAARRLARSRA